MVRSETVTIQFSLRNKQNWGLKDEKETPKAREKTEAPRKIGENESFSFSEQTKIKNLKRIKYEM